MSGWSGPEFVFELHVCRLAEEGWPPGTDHDGPTIVARQLGTQWRRWDTIVIECDPAGYRKRARLGEEALDDDLRFLLGNAPSDWEWYRDALPDPGYDWRYVRAAIHRGAARGLLEKRRAGNRIEIRGRHPYPAWIDRIIAIENKPDLTASAADALAGQLDHDVAVGLADEVWVATAATDERIEPAYLETMPVEAGIVAVDTEAGTGQVLWHPRRLDPEADGTLPEETGRDLSAERKQTLRHRIAERAWEGGWRSYLEGLRTDCRHCGMEATGSPPLPWCSAKGRPQTPMECHGRCPEFEPEPPAWRMQGWPLEGGPGGALKQVIADRRARRRPDST